MAHLTMTSKTIHITPDELKAIEEHKRQMSLGHGAEVSTDEAVEDFVENHRASWLQERQRHDTEQQLEEIQKFKWYRSEEAGRDVGGKTASEEWIKKYAHIWRQARGSLEASGFAEATLVIGGSWKSFADLVARLAEVAISHGCTIYLHRREIRFCNFILNGKGYVDVRSDMAVSQSDLYEGEEIELIVSGEDTQGTVAKVRREWGGHP